MNVTFPSAAQRPVFICYDDAFSVDNGQYQRRYKAGVYHHEVKRERAEDGRMVEVLVDSWICSVLKVICVVRANAGNQHSYLIEYTEHGEKAPRRVLLSQALLLGRPEEALKALRDLGVSVLHTNAKLVRAYLDFEHLRFSGQTPGDFWRSTKQVGWDPAPDCFVLPSETIGKQACVLFAGKVEKAIYAKSAGSIDDWKTNVAELCKNNPFLIFGVSSAFAGPLLELFNFPGIGFHLFGDSTSGKSTVLASAGSVWGPPAFRLQWSSTKNGLEVSATIRSSTLIVLDESHQADTQTLADGIYLLANGVAKSRMTKDISAREVARWRVCALSSGEWSLESHLRAKGIDYKAGQGIRIADVPVNGNFGLFDDLHGHKTGGEFADDIRAAAEQKYYGHAGPLFVRYLIEKWPTRSSEVLEQTLVHFTKEKDENGNERDKGLSAQETRVARGFALVALAGELAIAAEIVPWENGDATAAVVKIFDTWRAAQPQSARGKEHTQIVQCIVDFIDRHGNSRFARIDAGTASDLHVIRDQAGYWEDKYEDPASKKIHIRRDYLFTAAGLKEAGGNFGTQRVLAAIKVAEAFSDIDDKNNKKSVSRRLPEGGTKRLYHINVEKLRDELRLE
jgi:putative DNA primase/helicase